MNHAFCLIAVAWCLLTPAMLRGAVPPAAPPARPPAAQLQPPSPESPVEFFRRVLAMSAGDRAKALAARPEQVRAVVAARLKEFDALAPDEREARLRSLQLRWYLLPLMKASGAGRDVQLTRIPAADRVLVAERLAVWDRLPVSLQAELLANESVVRVFFTPDGGPPPARAPARLYPPVLRQQVEKDLARWQTLTETRRHQIYQQLQVFIDLPRQAREKTLQTLGESERRRMELTLKMFDRLPREQRERCIAGYRKFAELSPEERQEFLSSAERWQAMSAREREAWRSLVSRFSQLKITPPGARRGPAPPRPVLPASRSSVATNG